MTQHVYTLKMICGGALSSPSLITVGLICIFQVCVAQRVSHYEITVRVIMSPSGCVISQLSSYISKFSSDLMVLLKVK
jgi:hypothetical protein